MKADWEGNRLVSAAEMKELDRNTIEHHGVPSMVLMERAALASVDTLHEEEFDLTHVAAVCGPGNNGGDGIAIARLLHIAGSAVTIVFVGDAEKRSEETRRQWEIAESYGSRIVGMEEAIKTEVIANATTVIDAVFGIGGGRAPTGDFLDAIRQINRAGAAGADILAVDIPSGVSAETGEALGEAVTADVTVTFAYKKIGHTIAPGREMSGEVIVKDIGIY
jgi:NAD(P)H-hydrate epimerase